MTPLRAARERSLAALERSQATLRRSSAAATVGRALKGFYVKAYEENVTGLAAMVAYNLLLAVFPLALIALFIGSSVLRSPELQDSVFQDLRQIFPSAAETTLTRLLDTIRTSTAGLGLLALVASVWICSSFWGALDTAFCRIYHMECRGWVRQKRFALAMLIVSLLFIAATVALPALQSIVVTGAADLPLGLGEVRAVTYGVTLAGGTLLVFLILALIYRTVPNARVPWYAIWPGALGATIAITAVDYAFPAYLSNVSSLAGLGTSLIFIVIVLIWFYAVAIIILGGAVINAMRYEAGRPPHRARAWLRRRTTGATVRIVDVPESGSAPDGSVSTRQVADVVLPAAELERIWTPAYLERFARTYWHFLTRVSLGLLRVRYTDDGREIVLIGRPLRLLTFRAPDYEADADGGSVTWRIRGGLLVSPRGRNRGHLRLEVRRQSAEGAVRADGMTTVRVSSEVAAFHPLIAGWGWFSRLGRTLYRATQLRVHVIVTYAFLRSLARLELAESVVRSLEPAPEDTAPDAPPRAPAPGG